MSEPSEIYRSHDLASNMTSHVDDAVLFIGHADYSLGAHVGRADSFSRAWHCLPIYTLKHVLKRLACNTRPVQTTF